MAAQFCIHQFQVSWLLKLTFLISLRQLVCGMLQGQPRPLPRGLLLWLPHCLLYHPPPPPPPLFSLSKPPSVPSQLLFLEHCSTTSLLGFRTCGIFFLVYRLKSRPVLTPQFPSQVPFLPHLHSPPSGPNTALTFGRASEPQGG